MHLEKYLINDIAPVSINQTIADLQVIFNQLTYPHVPIFNDATYMGCIAETDAYCFDSEKRIADVGHAIEGFFVKDTFHWLDVLEAFAQNDTNVMPVLDEKRQYLGYYELKDIIHLFIDTPLFNERGAVLVVEKGFMDYSFSEIGQIVESNNVKLFGAFISQIKDDVIQITLKISNTSLNEVIQTFRRYSYNIVSGHDEDSFVANLKERSKYLDKYLNI